MTDTEPRPIDLTVLLPVWNGEHNLGRLLPRLLRVLDDAVGGRAEAVVALPYQDLSSGFRMYSRRVFEDIGPVEASGLDSLQEIVVKAFSQGWKIAEVPLYYPQPRTWTPGRMAELGRGYLETIGRLLALRNSVKAADYDSRAFDSRIPLQRS